MTKLTEGTKYDDGKLRLAEMMLDFGVAMEELCKVWEYGAAKYEKSNWKQVKDPDGSCGIDRYTNAMLRHLMAERYGMHDDESHLLHAAHIAFNALARLYFIRQRNSAKDLVTALLKQKGEANEQG